MTETTVPISLAMTVLNERASIERLLESIEAQSKLPTEVVVVDGGSVDGTLEILNSWRPPSGLRKTVISAPGANISRGRNLAIAASTTDTVAITDAGTVLSHNWLELLHNALAASPGVDVAGGFFRPRSGTFMQTLIAVVITPSQEEVDPRKFLPSSRSIAFTKRIWEEVRGYPEWLDYCEDLVFDKAVARAGGRTEFIPDAVVEWDARGDLKAFARQYYRYARGDGKAGLWPKRHIVRYAYYVVGGALTARASCGGKIAFAIIGTGFIAHMRQAWMRILRRRSDFGALLPVALLTAPAVVIVGDVAKMAGYPVGILWRARNRGASSVRETE